MEGCAVGFFKGVDVVSVRSKLRGKEGAGSVVLFVSFDNASNRNLEGVGSG